MSDQTLDPSNVVSITIESALQGLGVPNINTAALFSSETPAVSIPAGFAAYTNATDVGTDWGTSSKAYKIATAFFAQQPNVLTTNGYFAIVIRGTGGTEKIETAIARTITDIYYFGVLTDVILGDSDLANLATYMQTIDKICFYASATQADFAPGGPLDDLRTASETHTRGLYYNDGTAIDTQRMAAAYAGRALSTDFAGSNTTQTMHLKTLATIVPDETIDQTALLAASTAGVDVYVSFASLPALFTSGANAFFDEVYNELWFKFALQAAVFNLLKQTSTKIPQTEPGMEALKNTCRRVCAQAVRNGFAGPGSWNSPTVFGNPASLFRNIADIGYYVFSAPIADQTQADREDRVAPTMQIALKTQGAIHKANVIVTINL